MKPAFCTFKACVMRLQLKGSHPKEQGMHDAEKKRLQYQVIPNSCLVELRNNATRMEAQKLEAYQKAVKRMLSNAYRKELRKEELLREQLRLLYEKAECVKKEHGQCVEYLRLRDEMNSCRDELIKVRAQTREAENLATSLCEQGRLLSRQRMILYLQGIEEIVVHKVILDLPRIFEEETPRVYLSEPDTDLENWILKGVMA